LLGETEEINGNPLKYFGLCAEMRTCNFPIKTQECQPLELERDVDACGVRIYLIKLAALSE
jgi:hypothetical protein